MKKARIFLIFSVFLALFLTGCKAEDKALKKAQKRAVEIGEQFLDYELTAAEAKELLDDILVPETEDNGQLALQCDIDALSFAIGRVNASYEDVQDKVEYIRDTNY